jgi:CspA family cold shock protein
MSGFTRRSKGVIKWFNTPKGFGFIEPDIPGREVFLYVASWAGNPPANLQVGDRVEFDTFEMSRGLLARNLRKLDLTAVAE